MASWKQKNKKTGPSFSQLRIAKLWNVEKHFSLHWICQIWLFFYDFDLLVEPCSLKLWTLHLDTRLTWFKSSKLNPNKSNATSSSTFSYAIFQCFKTFQWKRWSETWKRKKITKHWAKPWMSLAQNDLGKKSENKKRTKPQVDVFVALREIFDQLTSDRLRVNIEKLFATGAFKVVEVSFAKKRKKISYWLCQLPYQRAASNTRQIVNRLLKVKTDSSTHA